MQTRRARLPKGKYLEHTAPVRVQLREVDALGIVWHGNYFSYFEVAREAFGRRYGLGYKDIVAAGLIAPVVQATCDYLVSARYEDEIDVTARLFRQEAAKAVFHYEARRRADATLLATGQTVQAFTDLNGELLLAIPQFMSDFYAAWTDAMLGADE